MAFRGVSRIVAATNRRRVSSTPQPESKTSAVYREEDHYEASERNNFLDNPSEE